jgi:hypothetical protein
MGIYLGVSYCSGGNLSSRSDLHPGDGADAAAAAGGSVHMDGCAR